MWPQNPQCLIIGGFRWESEGKVWRSFGFVGVAVAAALASFPATTGFGQETPAVFVPSLVNVGATPDKPSLAGIDRIRFVTGSDFPPFNFNAPDGTPTGFNVELARALCDVLQVTCTIQQRAWDRILPSVETGQDDAAVASVAITDNARRRVAFTAAYMRTPARFLVRRAHPLNGALPAAVSAKTVGVVSNTAHEAYLRQFFPAVTAITFSTVEAARAALRNGTVDALFADAVSSSLWLGGTEAAGCCEFAGGPYTESRFFGAGAGIAVRKTDPRLRQALDYALVRLTAQGRYAELYLKYFPLGIY